MFWERVAQSVEHLTFNQVVLGSSPSALTNIFNGLVPSPLGAVFDRERALLAARQQAARRTESLI